MFVSGLAGMHVHEISACQELGTESIFLSLGLKLPAPDLDPQVPCSLLLSWLNLCVRPLPDHT